MNFHRLCQFIYACYQEAVSALDRDLDCHDEHVEFEITGFEVLPADGGYVVVYDYDLRRRSWAHVSFKELQWRNR